MIIIFVEFIDQLIDYPINCASLSKKPLAQTWPRPRDHLFYIDSYMYRENASNVLLKNH